jgi:hypothetical protein
MCLLCSVQEKLSPDDELLDLSSEDEAVASDLDMHSLILSGLHQDTEPVKTAEEVIREIDDMMQVLSTGDSSLLCLQLNRTSECCFDRLFVRLMCRYCDNTTGVASWNLAGSN